MFEAFYFKKQFEESLQITSRSYKKGILWPQQHLLVIWQNATITITLFVFEIPDWMRRLHQLMPSNWKHSTFNALKYDFLCLQITSTLFIRSFIHLFVHNSKMFGIRNYKDPNSFKEMLKEHRSKNSSFETNKFEHK